MPAQPLGPDEEVAARKGPVDPEGPLHAAELALSRECLAGNIAALRAFERDYLVPAAGSVSRRGLSPADTEEVMQELRLRLLTGEHPRLMDYAGRGPLQSWLRVAAVRLALNYRRGRRPDAPRDLTLAALAPEDPELDLLKLRYADEIKRSIQAGLHALSMRQRLILRLHLVDGVSLAEIGRLYGVNRSTVSRWLGDARAQVLVAVRAALASRIGESDLVSLIRLLRSHIDISLSRLLAEPGSI